MIDIEQLTLEAIANTSTNSSAATLTYNLDCLKLKLLLLEIGVKPETIQEIASTSAYKNGVLVETPASIKFTIPGLIFELILRKNGQVVLTSSYATENFSIESVSAASLAIAILKITLELHQRR